MDAPEVCEEPAACTDQKTGGRLADGTVCSASPGDAGDAIFVKHGKCEEGCCVFTPPEHAEGQ